MTAQEENAHHLTPTQEAMLLYSVYATQSAAYFERFCYRYRGALDFAAFAAAWQHVVSRHSILRSSFHWSDENGPRQIVHTQVQAPIAFEDWRDLSAAQQEQRLAEFLEADSARAFDVSVAPLIRVAVLQTQADLFYIVISNHHLVLDGWSMGIVRREVSETYAALKRGQQPNLAAPPDFSAYLKWLDEQKSAGAPDFWKRELSGFTEPHALPIDRAPVTLPGPEDTFDEHVIDIPEELSGRLAATARKHRVTMSTIAQGAWAVLLSRYCRTADVLMGMTVSGRRFEYPEIDSLVGVLINTLPLRVRLPSGGTVATYLQELQREVSRLREHEDTPLKHIHEWSNLPNHNPLFETLVVFENFIGHDLQLNLGGEIELASSHLARTNYPLVLVVNPHAELGLRVIYHRSRFAAEAIERLLNHLVTIMENFATDLEQPFTSLNVLSDSEKHLLLDEWSMTAPAAANLKPAYRQFETQAAANPGAPALEHEGRMLTYAELNARANQLARFIRNHPGEGAELPLVGIFLERSIDLIVAVLAVHKAGAAYLPLDPTYPTARLSLMLEDSGAGVLLSRQSLIEKLPAFNGRIITVDGEAGEFQCLPEQNLEQGASLNDLAYVIYTSGSTGTPKGVGVEHGSLANFVQSASASYEITSEDRVLQFASLSFDASVEEIFCTLSRGATLVVRAESMITSPKQFFESCAQQRISVLDLPTGYWHHLVNAMVEDDLRIPESVRLVVFGGEQAHADHVAKWIARTGNRVRLVNTYGPTEATVVTTIFDLSQLRVGESVPIGRPIAGASVYVLDDTRQPAPVGVPGELYIGGAGVARGYLHRDDLTAQKFIANPFGTGRLYRSGDLVRYREDGNLEFLGRADSQMKIRGFRIELEEIESAIRAHDTVTDAVVKVVTEPDGDKRLCAYVVFDRAGETTSAALRDFLKHKLPPHMIPGMFMTLDSLPLTSNGKVDRRALPHPDAEQTRVAEDFVGPRTPTEELVAAAWCQALKLPRVGINENFFELGGHSLLAARVFAELQKAFTVELSLVDIFNAPTVAGLAHLIYEREAQQQESDELRSLLAELEELSDDEAFDRLADERTAVSAV